MPRGAGGRSLRKGGEHGLLASEIKARPVQPAVGDSTQAHAALRWSVDRGDPRGKPGGGPYSFPPKAHARCPGGVGWPGAGQHSALREPREAEWTE